MLNLLKISFYTTLTIIFAFTLSACSIAEEIDRPHDHEEGHDTAAGSIGFPGTKSDNQINRTVEVTALDIEFTPTTINVTHGETIKFIVKNRGNLPHEFVLGTESEQREHHAQMNNMMDDDMTHDMQAQNNGIIIPPGEEKEIVWTFQTNIEQFQYACNIPGHYEAGMYGEVTVKSVEE